ncbi:hypothetical protein NEDG_02261, partial [Nematocida displodere]
MKSKIVRSFKKVIGKVLGKVIGEVFGKALRCHLLCLIVLCVIVGCADEVSEPEYITSPYTEKTIAFFEKSSSEYCPNVLKTVEIDGKRCLLKDQTQTIRISLDKYTLKHIPKNLVKGIVFNGLTIDSNGSFDPAVLKKILSAFGTINADVLALKKLEIWVSSYNDEHPRTLAQTPTRTPKCILNVKVLTIYATPKTTIEWLQERVDLSLSRINLLIDCMADFGNLEVLDGFNAEEITSLMLYGIDKLEGLDCSLFREGPLPDELFLWDSTYGTPPKISEQIIQNMLAKEWVRLRMPVELWVELMKPSEQPERLTAGKLWIYLAPYQTQTLIRTIGMNLAWVKDLTLDFGKDDTMLTSTALEQTLDWISRNFSGLEELSVNGLTTPTLIEFVRTHTFGITTNPTLKRIEVFDVECMHIRDESNIVCFSLEAWELFGSGKLGDELANSQTDLSQLSPEQ